ncbi:MAG: transposase [Chitinispirillales bacterium]|nr:transposase [Chitinispirillales bacterium]
MKTGTKSRGGLLESDNGRKDVEISRLKAQINKDSSNSSKPPSADGFKTILNSREKSDRKVGGQKGHKGTTLTVPKNLDVLVREGKAQKKVVDLTDGAEKYISQWKIDLKTVVVYTEYRLPCGGGNMPCVFYGENLKALSVLLSNNGLISGGRLSDFFTDVSYGLITISEATIEKINREAAERIKIEGIKRDLLNGKVMHTDETCISCAQLLEYDETTPKTAVKSSFNAVIRTHSSNTATLYTANPHKDDEGVIRDGIIPSFCGILVHDHDKKYYKYGDRHATCGAHLSRELKGLHELYNVKWADKFRKFYVGMNDYKNKTKICKPNKLFEFEHEYDELLEEGRAVLDSMPPKSFGYEQLRLVLTRLRHYKNTHMLFIKDYAAPFTNNQAERDLRHCKTKQKVSGCFRSWDGLVCYAKICSFLSTSRKRKHGLLSAVKSLFDKPSTASC